MVGVSPEICFVNSDDALVAAMYIREDSVRHIADDMP
jgi:hypothetical protein